MSEHVHLFGRGANGRCRECGTESKAGERRRLKREKRTAPPKERLDLHAALLAKGGFDHDGNAS